MRLEHTWMPTTAAGLAWLKANAEKDGVVVTASGLQYNVMQSGPEDALSPKSGTNCECHYRGTLMDGTEFDSSFKRGKPTTFAPFQVVKGWTEAMQLMAEGDKWMLFLPSELAYGDSSRGEFITPGAVLIFELEILKVKGKIEDGTAKARPGPPPPPPDHAAVGCRVRVDGLAAKPQYNGLLGTVTTWDGVKGRAGVKLDNGEGGAGLMLKPANLLATEEPRPRSPCIVWLRMLHGLDPRASRFSPSALPCLLALQDSRGVGIETRHATDGLGDTGKGWAMLRDELRLSSTVRYTFPDAPTQPVSCNGGARMTSWMDLHHIPVRIGVDPDHPDDVAGLSASCTQLHKLLDAEIARGTPSTDIVLGGFSQGGAMALLAGYTYSKPLAGVVCFSGWAALASDLTKRVPAAANAKTPAFVAHGTRDQVVHPDCGAKASELLKASGVPTSYNTYPMEHSSHPSEMEDLKDWLVGLGMC